MDYYFYDYDQGIMYDEDEENDERVVFKMNEGNLSELWTNCIVPSLTQITLYIQKVLLWNIICRIGWIILRETRLKSLIHVISIICGIIVLTHTVGSLAGYIFIFGIVSYLLLFILHFCQVKRIGYVFGFSCLMSLILCESFQSSSKIWHTIRGTQMIATMKAVSLAFDIMDEKKIIKLPNLITYLGYIHCPGNIIMGPWISFEEYIAALDNGPKYKIKWIIWTISNTIVAIFFLIMSNCIVGILTTDYSWKWLVAYRDALSFRCSHYFVSFFSQATMSVAGLSQHSHSSPIENESKLFGYFVSKPFQIEFPRSLVQVVINWNIPMHRWLKNYVFRKFKPHGTALAIFVTYFVSSLLHGLNFQLYAVLLSLGFYTYVEYNLRYKIANIFNACILSSNCKRNCSHEHKWNSLLVLLINIILSSLTIAHLAYLGVMFEASTSIQEEGYSMEHTLTKWKNLDFLSHWVVMSLYIFYFII